MLRVIPAILLATALFAQTPPAAPPEVDAALRARITQFYQFEVAGKFNQALQLVAEDTKDRFVGANRPSYHDFIKIDSIQYSDNSTKASVIVVVTRLMMTQGFVGHPLPSKIPSYWKLENGQWFWYIDPAKLPASPFGSLGMPRSGAAPPMPGGMAGAPPGAPSPMMPITNPMVSPPLARADKTTVQLKAPGPSSDHVTFFNPEPWPLQLTVTDPKIAGLTVKLDSAMVKPAGKGTLTIEWSGAGEPPKGPVTVVVKIPRTNQSIPIKVLFVK